MEWNGKQRLIPWDRDTTGTIMRFDGVSVHRSEQGYTIWFDGIERKTFSEWPEAAFYAETLIPVTADTWEIERVYDSLWKVYQNGQEKGSVPSFDDAGAIIALKVALYHSKVFGYDSSVMEPSEMARIMARLTSIEGLEFGPGKAGE